MSKDSKKDLDKLRHSASHLLAAAVLELYPSTKPTLGPPIENGFYYDFDFGKEKISEDDLPKIEAKMYEIVKSWDKFSSKQVSKRSAIGEFKGNQYKKELIEEHAGKGEKITIYKSDNFVDLCSGGHIDSPKNKLKYFKLLSVAGAYWRGDEKNKMLTRIYGTAFFSQKDLDAHLQLLNLAEEINHRKIGKELELFAIYPEIGSGLPVWLPNGYAARRSLENYMIELETKFGYQHMLSPHIHKEELFKISGHLRFYDDSMYSPLDIEKEKYYLKPMNCPAGMLVFKSKLRSYNDLPIKLGELGTVYRYEKSGELHGLQRVRGFTQNDAHIFCTPQQLEDQLQEVMDMLKIFYQAIGFTKHKYVLAISDQTKEKYKFCGTKEGWKQAEDMLENVLKNNRLEYEIQKGEAAFYGPKIDILAVNVFGKADAISTIQVDFNLPERFDLKYVDKDGSEKRPFVIHRALVGSFERFFAFLIEYYKGAFPLWFSPTQVKVLPITKRNIKFSKSVFSTLIKGNIRTKLDDRNETLQAKIRDAQLEKVPYMLVIGDKEEKAGKIAIRTREGKDLGQVSLDKFLKDLKQKINDKSLDLNLG